jgi:hypothetical protein
MELHKIVKKLEKKMWKIITVQDIRDLVDPGARDIVREDARVAQTVYALKGQGVIQSIRNGLYFVSDGILTDPVELVDTHYWEIVRTVIAAEAGKDYIIGGEKALELLMMDFSIPYQLIVYTRDIAKKVAISPRHEILFRTMITGEKTSRVNAFGILKKQSAPIDIKINMKWEILNVFGYEAALLDTLTIHDHEEGIAEALALKFLKRYESKLERGNFGILVSIRYIRAINRLRVIAKTHGFTRLYENALDVIKKEGGGCFVTF